MIIRFTIVTTVLLLAFTAAAQSGRISLQNPETPVAVKEELTAEQLYEEANSYAKTKFAEFEKKKIVYSDRLYQQTIQEQKQLAAKNALILLRRAEPAGEDLYFLGMLHWIAVNQEAAQEALEKYLAAGNPALEKSQSARSVLIVVAARRKNFDAAEKLLAEYLAKTAVNQRERMRMEIELARSYREEKLLDRAAPHAEEAYRAAKATFQSAASRTRGLDELLNYGMLVFEIYRDAGLAEKAENALADLQKTGAAVESTALYYLAINEKIKFLIETGRKAAAMQFFQEAQKRTASDFKLKNLQTEILEKLKRRERHYQLLGEAAPELPAIDRWLPGEAKKLSDYRGKVVFLDFWATWCGPCLAAFPTLIDWHRKFERDGLVILGVTRYYGEAEGKQLSEAQEIEFLERFKKEHKLPYDFLVGKHMTNQIIYGALTLPTSVIIDRRGVIRYIEAGAGREEEISKTIEKLLAEK